MAKRMQYSVVGLPHYTIWHLYEPSVDDIHHMEEMEQERKQREKEEKEESDRQQKIKDQFKDTKSEWEEDGAAIQKLEVQEKPAHEKLQGSEEGPAAKVEKEPLRKEKLSN
jgi:mannan polymerase II complex ANP1 subunit